MPLIQKDDAIIDFEVLLPLPLNSWQGNEGMDHKEAFPILGMKWSTENWGTKWNAYGIDEGYRSVRETPEGVILTFQTAWETPRGWTLALFNTLRCDMTVRWLSEGGWPAHKETYVANDDRSLGGPSWKKEEIAEESPDHRHLHKLLWGVETDAELEEA